MATAVKISDDLFSQPPRPEGRGLKPSFARQGSVDQGNIFNYRQSYLKENIRSCIER